MTQYKNHVALDLIAVVLIVFIAYMLRTVLVPLIFAVILSTLIFPIVYYFETRLCFNRVLAISIAILLFCTLIFLLFVIIGIQFNDIMEKSSAYYESIEKKITQLIHRTEKTTGLGTTEIIGGENIEIKSIVKNNSTKIIDFITSSGSIIGDFVLTPLYMFLFLLYRDFLRSFILKAVVKSNNKLKMKSILNELYNIQHNYLVGLVIVMIIVGFLNSFGLLLLGVEFPFFFGFLCALLLLIPYIGIIIGSILPALIALATKDSYWYALGVIGIFGFIQLLEGNIITPKITGSKVSLNELVSIVSIIAFSMLWGIPGMILALPITASLKVVFDHSEQFKPIGFLLGSANNKYLESRAKNRLKNWNKIRANKSE